jgi:hypothetical protein
MTTKTVTDTEIGEADDITNTASLVNAVTNTINV